MCSQLTTVELSRSSGNSGAARQGFTVIRDDLLHPIAGSKLRKFDARFPQLLARGVTDIVRCSAVSAAQRSGFACHNSDMQSMQRHALQAPVEWGCWQVYMVNSDPYPMFQL